MIDGDAVDNTADLARAAFETAERLAPRPGSRDADSLDWARHYAALALAAQGVFRDTLPTVPRNPVEGSRPDLGYLVTIATSATAAAAALWTHPDEVAAELWDLTPEAGNLNGEDIDWLAQLLDEVGVNPADLYRWFDAADFNTPSVAAGVPA